MSVGLFCNEQAHRSEQSGGWRMLQARRHFATQPNTVTSIFLCSPNKGCEWAHFTLWETHTAYRRKTWHYHKSSTQYPHRHIYRSRIQTRDLWHRRQELYHWATSPWQAHKIWSFVDLDLDIDTYAHIKCMHPTCQHPSGVRRPKKHANRALKCIFCRVKIDLVIASKRAVMLTLHLSGVRYCGHYRYCIGAKSWN